jgi:hypothetical protein
MSASPIAEAGEVLLPLEQAQPYERNALNRFILNVRSINIAEIALDFNKRMRS